ncbi:MAG: oxidoreductase [Thermoprotei archaeon]|nr:MAG: oxidoreductase [Thermoprotei archaeon]
MRGNPYLPALAKIVKTRRETPDTATFRLEIEGSGGLEFTPGQFVEVSAFGYGEAPFSISSSPLERSYVEVTVRRVGNVTRALFNMGEGGVVGVRGPFGRGWPIEEMKGQNLLMIGGGIGIAPLRPLIEYVIAHRNSFGDVILLYGARTPKDIVYKEELERWREHIDVRLTVDVGDETWRGRTGVVTVLLDDVEVDPRETYSVQCGPPIMIYFVTRRLVEMGFTDDRILFSLERLMKCGMGFCGHCMIGGKYVCRDGPVFKYSEVKGLLEPALVR